MRPPADRRVDVPRVKFCVAEDDIPLTNETLVYAVDQCGRVSSTVLA